MKRKWRLAMCGDALLVGPFVWRALRLDAQAERLAERVDLRVADIALTLLEVEVGQDVVLVALDRAQEPLDLLARCEACTSGVVVRLPHVHVEGVTEQVECAPVPLRAPQICARDADVIASRVLPVRLSHVRVTKAADPHLFGHRASAQILSFEPFGSEVAHDSLSSSASWIPQ